LLRHALRSGIGMIAVRIIAAAAAASQRIILIIPTPLGGIDFDHLLFLGRIRVLYGVVSILISLLLLLLYWIVAVFIVGAAVAIASGGWGTLYFCRHALLLLLL